MQDKTGHSSFCAMLSRMKYIPRWSLMRCSRTETLAEHTAETAQLAYTLCCANNALYGGDARADKVAAAALFHDAPEIITGDLPTPVKYRSAEMKNAYKKIEQEAQGELLAMLPEELHTAMRPALYAADLTAYEKKLLKAADRLSAVIKCIIEKQSGNCEFDSAYAQQMEALRAMECPEADWFLAVMLPDYTRTRDELTRRD